MSPNLQIDGASSMRVGASRRRMPTAVVALAMSGAFLGAFGAQTGTALAATGSSVASGVPSPSAQALRTAKLSPNAQATLVTAEDNRIDDIRTAISKAPVSADGTAAPFHLLDNGSYTEVLTARQAPYTLNELLTLAPQTLVRLPDQSYLLQENLVVAQGATLAIGGTEAVTLRLKSQAKAFTSIISLGGGLQFNGTAAAPIVLGSWDTTHGAPDQTLNDGRAYVRAYGGTVLFNHVTAENLGFWSGRTGGVAITGTSTPGTAGASGAADAKAQTAAARVAYKNAMTDYKAAVKAAKTAAKEHLPAPFVPPVPQFQTTPTAAAATPAGGAAMSGEVANSTFTGNAFGIFVSNTDGFKLHDSTVQSSVSDGVALHQFVVNSTIERVTANGNAGSGFNLSRGVQGIVLRADTANANVQDGFRVSGRALGSGVPSSTLSSAGLSSESFGNIKILDGTASANGDVGVEILDGHTESVQNMKVIGNPEGIVVRNNATGAVISGNKVSGSKVDGIALRTGTVGKVTGNTVDGGSSGIVVRDARGSLVGNTVSGVTQHALTFAGAASGSSATGNVLSGRGSAAIYLTGDARKAPITLANNHTDTWVTTHKGQSWMRQLLHPMNILWALLVVVAVVGRFRARRQLRRAMNSHPYAATQPLVPASDVPAPRSPMAEENTTGRVSLEKIDQ
jgi:hypothetical protein